LKIQSLVVCIALVFLVPRMVLAEEVQSPATNLPLLQSELELAKRANILWSLAFDYQQIETKPKHLSQVIADIDSFLSYPPAKDADSRSVAQYKLIAAYHKNLDTLFASLALVGSSPAKFLYFKRSLPICFAQYEGGTVVLVTGIASDKIHNTLRTTPRARAATVVESIILPYLPRVYMAFRATKVRYVGMVVIYGSKDFLDESSSVKPVPEVVALVVDTKRCGEFVDGKLSDTDLVAAAGIYLADRDMATGIKKIGITLE
jgi:hypothetical protein